MFVLNEQHLQNCYQLLSEAGTHHSSVVPASADSCAKPTRIFYGYVYGNQSTWLKTGKDQI